MLITPKVTRRRDGVISFATKKYPMTPAVIKIKKNMAMVNLKVKLTRERKTDLNRFIDTIGFLGHVFPGNFIGPGAAPPADLSKFTPSTFSLIAVRMSKILEDFRSGPDLLERFFLDTPTIQF
jgi:hypothetical protein